MRPTTFHMLREFNTAFNVEQSYVPRDLDDARAELRLKLIGEEFLELVEAMGFSADAVFDKTDDDAIGKFVFRRYRPANLVEVADALGDLDYVICGTATEMGIPHNKVVQEIHRSNMSKLGEDGKPILREDGKILKGPRYFSPAIKGVLSVTPENNGVHYCNCGRAIFAQYQACNHCSPLYDGETGALIL